MNTSVVSDRVVTVVDLQIQNIQSVANALKVVGAQVRVVQDAADIAAADLLVLPGVELSSTSRPQRANKPASDVGLK